MLNQVLQVAERSYDAQPRSHHHAYCQVLLPAQGQIALACPGEHGWVGGGRVAVIPPGVEHRYHALGPNCIVVADFAADHLETMLALRSRKRVPSAGCPIEQPDDDAADRKRAPGACVIRWWRMRCCAISWQPCP